MKENINDIKIFDKDTDGPNNTVIDNINNGNSERNTLTRTSSIA